MGEAGVKKIVMFALATTLLAACASEPSAPPPSKPEAQAPAPAPEPDHCGAAEAQKYVGRARTEIPAPVHPNLQRVVCSTCAMTMDFNERRLNFIFDEKTGIVKEARCG